MNTLKKIVLFSLIAATFIFMGCQQQHDLEKLKAQVNELNDIMEIAILENDPESSLKLFTDDAISMPSYQPMMKGMDAFKEHADKQKPMNMKKFTLTTSEILVSGDFVVEIGTYDLVIDLGPEMGGKVPDKGKYLTLFEVQKDGSLLIKADTWNTDYNPWEMMMKDQTEGKGKK